MGRFIHGSRIFLLGLAFEGVLAGAGGLAGAIAGAILALLGRTVMGMNGGIANLMLVMVGFGAAAAITLGAYLMARHLPGIALQPRLVVVSVPVPVTEPEQVSS